MRRNEEYKEEAIKRGSDPKVEKEKKRGDRRERKARKIGKEKTGGKEYKGQKNFNYFLSACVSWAISAF
jgi:hypothetical protein